MKKNIINRRLVFEFLSITFAVFLGLMLNTWKDSHNNAVLAKKSTKNIKTEILKNKEQISELLLSHQAHLMTVDSLLLELETPIKVSNRIVNLKFKLISSTSWETAKITQAVAYMNLDLVTEVSGIYEYQEYYDNLIRAYSQERMTSVPETNDKLSLEKIKLFVSSIVDMEKNLILYYNDFLKS